VQVLGGCSMKFYAMSLFCGWFGNISRASITKEGGLPMYTKSLRLIASIAALLIVSVLLSQSVQAATATLGSTSIGSVSDTGDANNIDAWQFTTSSTQSGTITSMSVYISGPVSAAPYNQFQVAMYADAGGTPGALIASSASSTIVPNAWNTVSFTASLLPSTSYWLAYNTNGS